MQAEDLFRIQEDFTLFLREIAVDRGKFTEQSEKILFDHRIVTEKLVELIDILPIGNIIIARGIEYLVDELFLILPEIRLNESLDVIRFRLSDRAIRFCNFRHAGKKRRNECRLKFIPPAGALCLVLAAARGKMSDDSADDRTQRPGSEKNSDRSADNCSQPTHIKLKSFHKL